MRPSHLGGNAAHTPSPGTPIARATVIESYQDNQTHAWMLRVEIDGGKVQEGVRLITEAGGEGSGSSARLPARGVAGMIVWPSFTRQASLCYWLCTLEEYTTGLEREDAQDHLHVRADYGAEVKRGDGSVTKRYPGGDTLYDGPEGALPYSFKLRDRDFSRTGKAVSLDEVEARAGKALPKRVIRLVGTKSLREHTVELYKGRGAITASEASGISEVRAERHTPDDNPTEHRRAFYRGDALSLKAEVRVDQSGSEQAQAYVSLDADGGRAELRAEKAHKGSAFRIDNKKTYADTDLLTVGRDGNQMAFLASAPPTQENFSRLAQLSAMNLAYIEELQAQVLMAVTLLPILAPILVIPLPPPIPEKLQNVDSRSIKAKKGGSIL